MKPINILELVLKDLMRFRSIFSFLQIGAHDGMHLDPVRPFAEKWFCCGILVEPQPIIFKRLVKNYQGLEGDFRFENAALSHYDGETTLYTFADSALPDHATMLASCHRRAITGNTHGYQGESRQLAVKAVTLDSLIAKYSISTLDFLQIDTEGYDWEILKMLAQTSLRPKAINFEHAFLGQQQLMECYTMLSEMGYRLAGCGIDTIAMIQSDEFPRKQYEAI